MNKLGGQKKASAALTTVILISTILLASGITLVLTNVDLARASKSFFTLQKNKLNAETCIEESLFDIKKDFSYTGTFNHSNPVGTCTGTVTNDAVTPSIKIVAITSIVDGYYYSTTVKINTALNPIAIVK